MTELTSKVEEIDNERERLEQENTDMLKAHELKLSTIIQEKEDAIKSMTEEKEKLRTE